ncbi:MAG: fructose-1,6-bisphosphatase [Firmicutes bacterium]|nr:fructose-1,6-bisphosphatase [Clostridia bacterium]MBS6463859.1 fructose-1,6-bisphosphatase [Bacillota bacterium]
MDYQCLELLARSYRSPKGAMSEIINLQAILNLPKGTEHFLSDLHGEADTFLHILKNASGVIRTKIDMIFDYVLTARQKDDLAALIYYPEERLAIVKREEKDMDEWYRQTLLKLIEVLKVVASKYTRSKVRKALPRDYMYVIDELINMSHQSINKQNYYDNIISSIIELNDADSFVVAMCELIQRLAIDHLHIVGDIFDRGDGADVIVDRLMRYHSLDIQWGNHDLLWIGAACGNAACIANIIRINCTYRNLQILESRYGINLRPLSSYAAKRYADDPCETFRIDDTYNTDVPFDGNDSLAKLNKAITVIQLKLENAMIAAHPEFDMADRALYPETALTKEERAIVSFLREEFLHSAKLQSHIRFIVEKGSMYLVYNGNLLMHGCVPTDEDGTFTRVAVGEELFAGKALYDRLDRLVRDAFWQRDPYSVDYIWYLWCGKNSPVFGRDRMVTYEKHFGDPRAAEKKNPYYTFVKDAAYCERVLGEFGTGGKFAHIVNGHMPVKVKDGEAPESAGGKHITIDGGLAKAYHSKTGIGGYTLISNSQGLFLVSHAPFTSAKEYIDSLEDLHSKSRTLQTYEPRILVRDTDTGKKMAGEIKVLKTLLKEYYKIDIREKP